MQKRNGPSGRPAVGAPYQPRLGPRREEKISNETTHEQLELEIQEEIMPLPDSSHDGSEG